MAYQTISELLQKNNIDLLASEIHGLATGMLCIQTEVQASQWLAELYPEPEQLIAEDKALLLSLFEQTQSLLNEEDQSFAYHLFLPADDIPLSEQIEALRYWCEGFLFGIGYTEESDDWNEEMAEVIKDIIELTKLDSHIETETEEDQVALMEIQEYLRTVVMMIKG